MELSWYVLRTLLDTAQKCPQKVAVVLENQEWSYGELLTEVYRVVCYLKRLNISRGQIIYQFVEGGFEMVCGIIGIMCAGGVYCPLNPLDPSERVRSFLKRTQGLYVLLTKRTRKLFPNGTGLQLILLEEIHSSLPVVEDIPDLQDCNERGVAYMIYTSDTTGRQKIIVHTHKSFAASTEALAQSHLGIYTNCDHVLQVATCSSALHLVEISLSLALGSSLILMRSGEHLDMEYFCQTLMSQQVTTFTIGPDIIRALIDHLDMSQQLNSFKYVCNLMIEGSFELFIDSQGWTQFKRFLHSSNIRIFLQYSMPECGSVLGCELEDIDDTVLLLGYPFPGIQCLLIDEQGQVIQNTNSSSQIGQLHIGGPTLFNCYLNEPNRTANMFVTIDNRIYLKTGKLARYNARGELVYAEQVDFQIKMRGKQLETAEIEQTIMNFSPVKITNCFVAKLSHNDDLLVAYVISSDLTLNTERIQDYCKKYLQSHRVPSFFMILDKSPLNANGKSNRGPLPLPSFPANVA